MLTLFPQELRSSSALLFLLLQFPAELGAAFIGIFDPVQLVPTFVQIGDQVFLGPIVLPLQFAEQRNAFLQMVVFFR